VKSTPKRSAFLIDQSIVVFNEARAIHVKLSGKTFLAANFHFIFALRCVESYAVLISGRAGDHNLLWIKQRTVSISRC